MPKPHTDTDRMNFILDILCHVKWQDTPFAHFQPHDEQGDPEEKYVHKETFREHLDKAMEQYGA